MWPLLTIFIFRNFVPTTGMGCLSSKERSSQGTVQQTELPETDPSPTSPKNDRPRGESLNPKPRLPPSQGGKPVDPRYHMKLGLVGTSSCGKTTLAKQMRILHTRGFTDEERNNYKKILSDNLILAMKELSNQAFHLKIPVENEQLFTKFKGIDPYKTQLTPDLADSIRQYWADKGYYYFLLFFSILIFVQRLARSVQPTAQIRYSTKHRILH